MNKPFNIIKHLVKKWQKNKCYFINSRRTRLMKKFTDAQNSDLNRKPGKASSKKFYKNLFTTSKIELGINTTWQDKRDSTEQNWLKRTIVRMQRGFCETQWYNYICRLAILRPLILLLIVMDRPLWMLFSVWWILRAFFTFSWPNHLWCCQRSFWQGLFFAENPSYEQKIAWAKSSFKEYKTHILNFSRVIIDELFHPMRKDFI